MDLQKTVGEPSSLEKPFVNVTDGRRKEEAAADTVKEALCHDDL